MNTDFSLPTDYQQLTTEGPFVTQKRDLNDINFEDRKQDSSPSNATNHLFTSTGIDYNQIIRNCKSENKIVDDSDRVESLKIQQYNDQQDLQINVEKEYMNNSYNFNQQQNQINDEILQIRIDHSEDVFEYFEKEPSYQAIEIIDYERFLSLVEFAQIDLKLRKLSKKFKALRITNVDLTAHHLKILQYGILQNRRDLEIQFNNNNIEDQSFFQFLLESRCFKLIQFINNIVNYLKNLYLSITLNETSFKNLHFHHATFYFFAQSWNFNLNYIIFIHEKGILKFIDQIYDKYTTKSGKRRNMLRLSDYNIVLEKSDDDLVFTLHTGSNQFRYLKDWSDQQMKYQVVSYDIKQCSQEVVRKILQCEFTRNHLPIILSLSVKVESWNVEQLSDVIQKINTISTLDLGGSVDLAEQDVAKIFFHEKTYKIKQLIIRDIPFKNPAFKLFIQHFVYSNFTITKCLDISNCEINDDKIFLLCENIRTRKDRISLQQIFMQRNPFIGTEGWRRFFSMMVFGSCTAITDLDIRGCLLTKSHLEEGIIAGYKASSRISKKFCIRMPLKSLFISTSEMTPESWKIFTKEFLFHPKINLDNYYFFFTGYFMSNKILSNYSHYDKYQEIKSNLESKNNQTLLSSLKQSQKNQENELTAQSKTQLNQSGHSTPKSLKVYNLNQLHFEIKKIENQYVNQDDQNYPKFFINNDQNSYKTNIQFYENKQQSTQTNDQFLNKSYVDDTINVSGIQNELNSSNINLKSDNNQNQIQIKTPFQQGQTFSNSRSQSQTSLNQTKSKFSKQNTQKLQIHKINIQDDSSQANILNQSNYEDISFTQFQPEQFHLQVNQKNIFNSTQKSKSLNDLGSPQFQESASKDIKCLNNKEPTKYDSEESCGIYLQNEDKQKHLEEFEDIHQNEKFKNQLISQKLDRLTREFSKEYEKHHGKENDSLKTKSNKEQTLNLIYNSDLDNLRIEQIPGVHSTFSQSVQISYLELLQAKQKSSQNTYSSLTQPLSVKNDNGQQKQIQGGQLVRLHSYSHQKKNLLDKNNLNKHGTNQKIVRSISYNNQNKPLVRIEENSKQNVPNKQEQDKNIPVIAPYYKKSSFGLKHVKSAQEILENINQVVSQNNLPEPNQSNDQHDNFKTSQKDSNSKIQVSEEKTNTLNINQNFQEFQKKYSPDDEISQNSKNLPNDEKNNMNKSSKEQQLSQQGLLNPPKQVSHRKLSDKSSIQRMQFVKVETLYSKNQSKDQSTTLNPNESIKQQSSFGHQGGVEQSEQEKAESEKLNFKQIKVIDKYRKNNIFYKKYRVKNESGVINKQEILGSVENGIFNLFEHFIKQKKPHLQQIIFHTTDQFPYLSSSIQQQYCGAEFQGNISPAGWSRLFFFLQKCQIFIVPLSNNNPQIPITPLFNEKYEYLHPIPEEIIKSSTSTQMYSNLQFFYINADRLYHKIYQGSLTPIQWLYFNPQSNIKIIKSNCYSTFINLEKNLKIEGDDYKYNFKTETIDFNWEGEDKGWKIFAVNVMLNKRFQLKNLYLKNVKVDKIISVIEEYKLKYNKTEIPSTQWNLRVLSFSFSSCQSAQSLAKFLFYFFNQEQLKVIYNGVNKYIQIIKLIKQFFQLKKLEDLFYVFGSDFSQELMTFNISQIDQMVIEDPYCLNSHLKYPFNLYAPYVSQFFVNIKGQFSPHFFTKSVSVQLMSKFQRNKIIQAFDRQISTYLQNLNRKIQNNFQSRSPSIPALKLKQFICESNEKRKKVQYLKLMEPCLILNESREDFSDQIVQFNCSLFEGGSLIIDPQKLTKIITTINLINLYQFQFIDQINHEQKFKQQESFRTYSIQKKINQEIHIYLSLEDKLRMYGEITGLKNQSKEIKLYANYIQYLQHKSYLEKMSEIGLFPTYHHPYNYYNCLYINCKSVVLDFQKTCSNSCGQRCGKTADIIFYYKETLKNCKQIPDYLTYVKLNKKVSPYFFSPFLYNKIIDLFSEEHILSFLFCTVYSEDYNYRFFDYIQNIHIYLVISMQLMVGVLMVLYCQYAQRPQYVFDIIPTVMTFFIFLWQISKVMMLIQKSKSTFAMQSIISRKRTFEKKQTIRNRQQVRQLKNKNSTQEIKYESSKNLEEIDCSPSSHWLLYQTPLEIFKQNKLLIYFASFRSFIGNLSFYTQVFNFNVSVIIYQF